MHRRRAHHSATEFERLSGKGTAKKWRQSVRVVDPDHSLGESVSKVLKQVGEALGKDVVKREIEVFWPGDECFYHGTVMGFRPESGEHEVVYDDGNKEILQIPMQTVRWGPAPTVRKGSAAPRPMSKAANPAQARGRRPKGKDVLDSVRRLPKMAHRSASVHRLARR